MRRVTVRRRGMIGAWPLAARCITVLVGGYMETAGIASLFARVAPIARVEATAWGMILSFAVFAALALWGFHEARFGRVAVVIWGSAAASIALVLMLGVRP